MPTIASFFIRMAGRAASGRFETATLDPVAAQQRKLEQLVGQNADTEYGKRYGFGSVRTFEDYRRQVPLISYEDVKEDMERVTKGASNVFTAEDPVIFARTSGTTGDSKFIPVTPTCQGRDHSDQMRTWLYRASQAHPGMFGGKIITMVSPAVEGHTESGIPYGSTSGMIYRDQPKLVQGAYAIPYDVFEIEDYEAKYYVLMLFGLANDVTFMATANPSSIVKMCQLTHEHSELMIRDLRDGTISEKFEIDPKIRAALAPRRKGSAARAREVEAMRARRDGRLLPRDYWPRLALIGCWKGGTVGTYLDRFPEWFDPDRQGMVPTRDWGYLSSEGRCSIPLTDHGSGGVLTIATNLYEFVPIDDLEDNPDDPSAWNYLGVGEVEEDRQYYIFLSTTGGLYRYDINDVVEVVDFYNRTPVIEFRRKGRGMTNITGEKVSVNQIIGAFEQSAKQLGVTIDHFKAHADVPNARYVFTAEIAAGLPENKRRPLLHALDDCLKKLNIEYEAKRKSLRLNDPVLQLVRPGWYDAQKKHLKAGGKRVFQAKTVLLDAKDSGSVDREDVVAEVSWSD